MQSLLSSVENSWKCKYNSLGQHLSDESGGSWSIEWKKESVVEILFYQAPAGVFSLLPNTSLLGINWDKLHFYIEEIISRDVRHKTDS